eukprot:141004-Hanusia_phi.AAC.4
MPACASFCPGAGGQGEDEREMRALRCGPLQEGLLARRRPRSDPPGAGYSEKHPRISRPHRLGALASRLDHHRRHLLLSVQVEAAAHGDHPAGHPSELRPARVCRTGDVVTVQGAPVWQTYLDQPKLIVGVQIIVIVTGCGQVVHLWLEDMVDQDKIGKHECVRVFYTLTTCLSSSSSLPSWFFPSLMMFMSWPPRTLGGKRLRGR